MVGKTFDRGGTFGTISAAVTPDEARTVNIMTARIALIIEKYPRGCIDRRPILTAPRLTMPLLLKTVKYRASVPAHGRLR
jgi:hypothetical protein